MAERLRQSVGESRRPGSPRHRITERTRGPHHGPSASDVMAYVPASANRWTSALEYCAARLADLSCLQLGDISRFKLSS